jgi:hypothetical protein
MNIAREPAPSPKVRSRWPRLLSALGALLLATACGGGGGDGVDTGGTGGAPLSYTSGSINGFGSVIVNGIRFDDAEATVTDDDGNRRSRDDLRLGMSAEVEGSAIVDGATGPTSTAQSIRFGSEILGPVESVDPAAHTVVVLGQTVVAGASTVFDDELSGGLAALRVGDRVEVYGRYDAATARYDARRIERKGSVDAWRLRGVVSELDRTARRFLLGGQPVSYAGLSAADVPADLADGRIVKLRLRTVQVGGVWIAEGLRDGAPRVEDREDARVEGRIDSFVSAGQFSVNGLAVDASAAAFKDGATAAQLAVGVEVEIRGQVRDGVLKASEVEIDDHDDGSSGGGDDQGEEIELHGALAELDTAARSFVLRGVRVSYAGPVEFRDGTAADLANGRQVEVRGRVSSDGTGVSATRIEFDD